MLSTLTQLIYFGPLRDLEYFHFNFFDKKAHTWIRNYEWCSCQKVVNWVAIHIFIRNLVSCHFISIQPPVEAILINIWLNSFHFNISSKQESRCFLIYGIASVMKPNVRLFGKNLNIGWVSGSTVLIRMYYFFRLSYNNL